MNGEIHYHDIRALAPVSERITTKKNNIHKRRVRRIKTLSQNFIKQINKSTTDQEETFLSYLLSTGDDHTVCISSFNSLLPPEEKPFQLIHR